LALFYRIEVWLLQTGGCNHSRSFDHRRREPVFLTAIASVLRCPTSTTRRLLRVARAGEFAT
jgi:hypothetical protein